MGLTQKPDRAADLAVAGMRGEAEDSEAPMGPQRGMPQRDTVETAEIAQHVQPDEHTVMRMLSPRELFNAQGFPSDYVIEGVRDGLDSDEPTFRPFSKDVQISCCGNSVCPPVAAAIIAANCQHLAVPMQAEEANNA
ncbi:DNA cytosine methyltransferase [Rhodovulum viride]|uniref:DNA cytosine methyltransferase n=1 Tax=Rhodovulum viride TaxID=1231134 RepID=UPI001FE9F41B|nr:DNA cytosine methyltransferase [Rhodovulum viride]